MIPPAFLEAIVSVAEALEGTDMPWMIIGSANLALQGMPESPKDLDIITRVEDLDAISVRLHSYSPSGITPLATKSAEPAWEMTVEIDGIQTQFCGERADGTYARHLLDRKIVYHHVSGHAIPLLALEQEAACCLEIKRPEKAAMIRGYLSNLQRAP